MKRSWRQVNPPAPRPGLASRREPRPRAPRQTWGPWRTRAGHPPADTRTLGAPAQPGSPGPPEAPSSGGRRRGERGHMVPAPRPAAGAHGWRGQAGAPLPSSSSSPPLLFPLSFLRDSPSLFSFSFFPLSFPTASPAAPWEGAGRRAARKLRPGTGRCRLHLLEPGKLWSALGEAGVWDTLAPLPAILGPEPCLEMLGGTGDPEVKSRLHCPSRGTGSKAPPLPPVSWLLQLSQVPRPQPLPQDHQEHRGVGGKQGPLPFLAGRGALDRPGQLSLSLSHFHFPPSPAHLAACALFPFFFPGCTIPSPFPGLSGGVMGSPGFSLS